MSGSPPSLRTLGMRSPAASAATLKGSASASVSGRRRAVSGKEPRKVRPATSLLLWMVTLLAGCGFHHPLGAGWEDLPAEGRETAAIEAVRTALAQRGGRIPGRPGSQENEVLFVGRRLAIYRPCCGQSDAEASPGNLAVLLFRDIVRLERRVVYDFPSQPEDLSIYLRWKSPSAWGVRAEGSLLSPLLSRVRRGGAVLLLPQRPRDTYRRLEAALEYLLSLPPPPEGVERAVEGILRQSFQEERDRARFEADVLAALGAHLPELR